MMTIMELSDKEEGTTMVPCIKRKRTKRQRPQSPLALTMASPTQHQEESGGSGGGHDSGEGDRSIIFSDNIVINHDNSNNNISGSDSPVTSIGFSTSTDEEEDMANCLILLAQGHNSNNNSQKKLSITEPNPININSNIITSSSGKTSSLYVNYQCKTCNRCFPSFQALGGHRASHKKPKTTASTVVGAAEVIRCEENKKRLAMSTSIMDQEKYDDPFRNGTSTTLSLQISNSRGGISANNNTSIRSANNNNNKVHECSICGAEFSSGQALGGHMRRHRAFINPTTAVTVAASSTATTSLSMGTSGGFDDRYQIQKARPESKKRPRHILQLDLNLPAPEDHHHHDRRESKFGFASKEQVIVFSTSSLVNCHY